MPRIRSALRPAAVFGGFLVVSIVAANTAALAEPPVRLCATIPDLASLAREVAGDDVDITVFTKGPQDPHFLEAKPSFITSLSRADLFIEVGLELEMGWTPVLLRSARNSRVVPGSPGYVDASRAIVPLEVPGLVDRSMGDVHALGNPHYLLDPLNGLRVAALIRDWLAALRPERRSHFESRFDSFRRDTARRLLGDDLLEKYSPEEIPKLLLLVERGGLERFAAFLEKEGQTPLLGGWLGSLLPHAGARVVADHNLWPYFARRFGLEVIGFLEPKPGIAPTTRHLTALIERMKAERVGVVLVSSYFNRRHADLVAEHTGAVVAAMAHQVGARKDIDTYIAMIDHNVRELLRALAR